MSSNSGMHKSETINYLTNDREIEGQRFVCLSMLFRQHQEELKREHEEYKIELEKEMKELAAQREARISQTNGASALTDNSTELNNNSNETNNNSTELNNNSNELNNNSNELAVTSTLQPNLSSQTKKPFDSNFGTIKIRGVFGTYEEAAKHAAILQKTDPYFNIWVGEVGKWLPLDPNPESVKDIKYYEPKLNEIIGNERERLADIAVVENQRKEDLISMANKSTISDASKGESEKKKKKRKRNKKPKITPEELEKLKDTEKKEMEALGEIQNKINSKEIELMEFNRKLEEIKELHKKSKA